MVKQGTVLSELQSIAGKTHAREPSDRDVAVDGLTPQAVGRAGTYEEVAEVLRYANARAAGGHSTRRRQLHAHRQRPSRYDIALEHCPPERGRRVRAGRPDGDLPGRHHARRPASRLRERGQMVPLRRRRRIQHRRRPAGAPRLQSALTRRPARLHDRHARRHGDGRSRAPAATSSRTSPGTTSASSTSAPWARWASSSRRPSRCCRSRLHGTQWLASSSRSTPPASCRRERGQARPERCEIQHRTSWRLSASGSQPAAGYVLRIEHRRHQGRRRALPRRARRDRRQDGREVSDAAGLSEAAKRVPEWASSADPVDPAAVRRADRLPALDRDCSKPADPAHRLEIDPAAGSAVATWLGAGSQGQLIDRVVAAVGRLGGHVLIRILPAGTEARRSTSSARRRPRSR